MRLLLASVHTTARDALPRARCAPDARAFLDATGGPGTDPSLAALHTALGPSLP
jgi:hypothetical protein